MLKESNELLKFMAKGNVLFVLDSSAILDIYKHDQAYSYNLLKAYQVYFENLWIPKQVKKEVEKNHYCVKESRKKEIEKLPQNIKRALSKLESSILSCMKNPKKYNYPGTVKLENDISSKISELEKIVDEYKCEIDTFPEEDQPDVINNLLRELEQSNKIGEGYDKFDKLNIYIEGNVRHGLGIPPGFEDAKLKDKKDPNGIQKFGDLIIWKEILDKVSSEKTSLLFITSDVKEDWWKLNNDNKIEDKHPMLNLEFEKRTGLLKNQFEMLYTGTFFSLMLGTDEFLNKSYDDSVKLIATDYSLNSIDKLEAIITISNIEGKIIDELNLYYEFINGDFSLQVENSLNDIEFNEIINTEILDTEVSIKSNCLVMEIELNSTCCVTAESIIYDNSVEFEYDVTLSYFLIVSIPLIDRKKIKQDTKIPEYNEENLLDFGDIETEYAFGEIIEVVNTNSPFDEMTELCVKCQMREGVYATSNGDLVCSRCSESMSLCPDCGRFFPQGSIGAFCDDCTSNH